MEISFKHPLARKATAATLRRARGKDETVLVIVTTLELDERTKGFSLKNIHRLNEAAQAFIAETGGFAGYAIINRPKDWDA